jgi:hypothetical protein
MEDPFAAVSSSSVSPSRAGGHKPSLTALIANSEVAAATEGLEVELPSAPPLDHTLFQGEDFDPSEFLLGRRHTALDELRSEVSTATCLAGVALKERQGRTGWWGYSEV